jgi:hypothetical protein
MCPASNTTAKIRGPQVHLERTSGKNYGFRSPENGIPPLAYAGEEGVALARRCDESEAGANGAPQEYRDCQDETC